MGRGSIYTFIVFIVGISMFLGMAGIGTAGGLILDWLGLVNLSNASGISLGTFFVSGGLIFTAAAITGIIIGAIAKSDPVTFLLAGFAGVLLTFVGDIVIVVTYANTFEPWVGSVVALLMVPIAAGYLITIISWWAGK